MRIYGHTASHSADTTTCFASPQDTIRFLRSQGQPYRAPLDNHKCNRDCTRTHEFNSMKFSLSIVILLCPLLAIAQLAVTVSPPKIIGQKAVVKLAMKNNLTQKVESARAVCFLFNEQGQMVGQSTKWVIGGAKNRPALELKQETTFNFVVTSSEAFTTTNLTAKVSFTQVGLENSQAADVAKTVSVKQQ